ncbi:CDP-diacylglycerol--glycerol-3-phosphate 3-phosphatidyltransferase 2 [Beta vulgaris subsp. vulgaris]|uniref:CDP-diacylglycerol--glycerol-3-phosphate 3-phosphatidyltransferase 2 n=1 Tax=Beta vulgaris subsp. vulgaris TaxID=3555 RepID=UPI002037042F|nr:CDP-diacylglycerol--glycerol-3-phosphate 3-phosphatidyltransferase 2 [Beta vulgaris subsp. vulgaris]
MPALNLLLRRTIASAAMKPPSILRPPPSTLKLSTGVYLIRGSRSTLAKGGARLGVQMAHVKGPTTKIILVRGNNNNNNNNINRKRVYMLSSSSSSSPFSEERESEEREGDKLVSSSSSTTSSPYLLTTEMGQESRNNNNKNNDKGNNDVDCRTNDVVSGSPLKDQKDQQCSKLLTLPTVLTLARVAAIPVFIATFYANSWWGAAATTSIFVAAAITDWLDGYLARKMRLGTAFGAFLDPVADKLMVAATLVLLCSRPPEAAMFGDIPWLYPVPAIVIIGREITMSAVREWAASQDAKLLQAVAVNNLGKWKTATQMTALTFILATRDGSVSSQGALAASGVVLLYISAGLAAWSLVVYMRKIGKVLMR